MFLLDHSISTEDSASAAARRATDPAVIARLLVFATELEDDAEAITTYAREIREGAITAYRQYVIERRSYKGSADHA
jgi:hypothetical protein